MTTYTLLAYGSMLSKSPRLDGYVELVRAHTKPGALVMDLGAGFGFFAVLAATLGAEHVFAVEPAEPIHFGKLLAREHGVSDKITWVNGLVQDAALPRPVDLIISDLRGILPLHGGHLGAIRAARSLLAPGGVLAPMRDTLFVGAVGDSKPFQWWLDPWTQAPGGISLESIRRVAVNSWGRGRAAPEHLLGPAKPWLAIDYATVEPGRMAGSASLEIERTGPLHGLAVWFDTELAPGIGFSNAPGQPHSIYANAMFPLERVVEVTAGSRVDVEIAATPVNDDWDWQWHVRALSPTGDVLLDERHHTMLARPLPALVKKLPDAK